jgi:putative transposase
MLHRARSLVIAQRRSLGNTIRAHLAEFGMVGPQGRAGLRQIEVLAAQGRPVAEAVRSIGVTEKLRDELLDGEVFHTLREAQVLIEQWRRHFNTIRPHSTLGYRPPAPEVAMPGPPTPLRRPDPTGSASPAAMLH